MTDPKFRPELEEKHCISFSHFALQVGQNVTMLCDKNIGISYKSGVDIM